jgi:hypothetical protein
MDVFPMLSKCLNPTRSAPFRYLREGRIFHPGSPVARRTWDGEPPPRILLALRALLRRIYRGC